jgi:hypothetical protein
MPGAGEGSREVKYRTPTSKADRIVQLLSIADPSTPAVLKCVRMPASIPSPGGVPESGDDVADEFEFLRRDDLRAGGPEYLQINANAAQAL